MPWEGYTVILDPEQFFTFDPKLLIGVIVGNKIEDKSKQEILSMIEKRRTSLELWGLTTSKNNELSIKKFNP